jgi:hypothetical protein
MNKQVYDSLTMNERLLCEEYMAHHEPRKHIRHTKECLGCADAGEASNWNGQRCRDCERNIEAFDGNR